MLSILVCPNSRGGDPGHAQANFGEALAEIAGVERKIHLFAMAISGSLLTRCWRKEDSNFWSRITSRRLQQLRAQAQFKLLGVAHQLLRGTAELGSPAMRQMDQPGNLGLGSRRLPMPRSSAASAHPRREGLLKFRALT